MLRRSSSDSFVCSCLDSFCLQTTGVVGSSLANASFSTGSVRCYDQQKGNSLRIRAGEDSPLYFGDFGGTCVSNTSMCTNGFTLAFWFNLQAKPNGTEYYMDTGAKDGDYGLAVYHASGNVMFEVKVGQLMYGKVLGIPEDIPEKQWTHIIMTFDSGSVDVYVNKISPFTLSTASFGRFTPQDSSTSFLVGLGGDAVYDEIAFWERVLDATERDLIYSDDDFANSNVTVNITDYPDTWNQTFTVDAPDMTTVVLETASEESTTEEEGMTTIRAVVQQTTFSVTTPDIPSTKIPTTKPDVPTTTATATTDVPTTTATATTDFPTTTATATTDVPTTTATATTDVPTTTATATTDVPTAVETETTAASQTLSRTGKLTTDIATTSDISTTSISATTDIPTITDSHTTKSATATKDSGSSTTQMETSTQIVSSTGKTSSTTNKATTPREPHNSRTTQRLSTTDSKSTTRDPQVILTSTLHAATAAITDFSDQATTAYTESPIEDSVQAGTVSGSTPVDHTADAGVTQVSTNAISTLSETTLETTVPQTHGSTEVVIVENPDSGTSTTIPNSWSAAESTHTELTTVSSALETFTPNSAPSDLPTPAVSYLETGAGTTLDLTAKQTRKERTFKTTDSGVSTLSTVDSTSIAHIISPSVPLTPSKDSASQTISSLRNLVNTTLQSEGNINSQTAALLFNSTAALADYSTVDADDGSVLAASAKVYIELASLLVKSFDNYSVEEATEVVAVRFWDCGMNWHWSLTKTSPKKL
ncbi:cell wall protein DAN4-like [Acanthaster planci]|uniref:Cell wall protein DAN4-like n=1 Tax=Acanthaster planci TaxID=133434 RepID=A0A8B7ZXD4_ACAPL|nr:cell wall protein DAN4-like [Acanthaster planci]XP_022110208.1 cell wall protein DAN4-like [Acanthaster planci]XP_022110218.1 cell wall protein DAN4-like [Acanthaster planci]